MSCQPVYLSPYRESGILSWIDHIKQFSAFYQEFLTGSVKYQASKGSPINYSAKRVKDKSRVKIGEITPVTYDGITYNILMSAGILHVETGGIRAPIVSAPAKMTKAKKTAFLKAVVRTLIDDPENIFRYIKPGRVQETAPAVGPAVVQASAPETAIENITLSPFPGPGTLDQNPVNFEIERENLSDLLSEELSDMGTSEYDDISLLPEYNRETPEEIIKAFSEPEKVTPAGWIPHLKLSITEEMIRA
jgi:hypothetical protein